MLLAFPNVAGVPCSCWRSLLLLTFPAVAGACCGCRRFLLLQALTAVACILVSFSFKLKSAAPGFSPSMLVPLDSSPWAPWTSDAGFKRAAALASIVFAAGAALVAAIELAKEVKELRAEIKALKAELNK